jgi:hypothetical protein
MALTINTSSTVNITAGLNLLPIYSDIVMTATDPAANVNNFYFQIYVNTIDTFDFVISANANGQASLNLSTALDGIIDADPSIGINDFLTKGNVANGRLKQINYIVTSRDINGTTINQVDQTSSFPLLVYNGVITRDDPDVRKDPNYYLPNVINGHWLRTADNEIYMQNPSTAEINDPHFLSFFDGNFGGSMPVIDVSILEFIFNCNGTLIPYFYTLTKTSEAKTITLNLSKIISLPTGINFSTCQRFTVSSPFGQLPAVTVNLVEPNKIHNPYNIMWTNQLGVQEGFLFNRVPQKDITITTSTLGWYTKKIYNIDIDPVYFVYSDLMDDENSKLLEDLWYTPSAWALSKEWLSKQKIIIVNDDTRTIYNRFNTDKMTQYQISFAPSARQVVQRS